METLLSVQSLCFENKPSYLKKCQKAQFWPKFSHYGNSDSRFRQLNCKAKGPEPKLFKDANYLKKGQKY